MSCYFGGPDVLLPYIREAGFGYAVELRDFIFDNTLHFTFVERWRPETHSFHLPCEEVTIILQYVAYHLRLRTNGDTIGGCI
ncbi:hypothetical protein AHAS_Ahas18G0212400 [Arachis hypogaea]